MTDTAEQIAAQIMGWNCADVRDLAAMLREFNAVCDADDIDPQGLLDMTSLPSAPLPADIDTASPIWAMDTEGRCLVGDGADQIETLDDLRA